jgi:hypothetical protein
MSRVAELIDLIVQGKNAEASDVLNHELLSRSHQAVNDSRPAVAGDYFAPVIDMPSDGSGVTGERAEYVDDSQNQEEDFTDEAD